MNCTEYWDRNYHMDVSESCDTLSVKKNSGGDWCYVRIMTNGRPNGEIVIRSKEMAEQLRFMLGQMLAEEKA